MWTSGFFQSPDTTDWHEQVSPIPGDHLPARPVQLQATDQQNEFSQGKASHCILLRFSQARELLSSKAASTIAFFVVVDDNYDHKQRTLKRRNKQNGWKSANHRSQTMAFWTRLSKVLCPKRSAKMIDSSEKRKLQVAFELQSSRHIITDSGGRRRSKHGIR